MAECKITVKAGICGKTTVISAKPSEDMMNVIISIESDCPMVSKEALEPICSWEEVGAPFSQSKVYTWAERNIKHTACPVPCAVVKAVEVGGDLGLKKDVSFKIE